MLLEKTLTLHNIKHIKSVLNKDQNHYYHNIFFEKCSYQLVSIAVSKLIETKTNSKYLLWYLDEVLKPLAIILPKMSGYVKDFKVKDGNKDNKLMSFPIYDEKLLERYRAIWTNIEELKNINLNTLPVYDNRYM